MSIDEFLEKVNFLKQNMFFKIRYKKFENEVRDLQCGNFRHLLLIEFYVKSIFGNFRGFKTAILAIFEALKLELLEILLHFQMWIFLKNQNPKSSKLLKWQFLTFWNQLNWFHVNSEWLENYKLSTLCDFEIEVCSVFHSVEITEFFYHSDFTWNQS